MELDRNRKALMSLYTPGPVAISDQAREALLEPMMHHRSDRFSKVWTGLLEDLQVAFQSKDETAILTSSGTGAMEATVSNLFSPGHHLLVPVSGKFSKRWAQICNAFGMNVSVITLAPGESPTPDHIGDCLRRNKRISGVLLTQCETSTGSLTDIKSICEAISDAERTSGKQILSCADCISSLCADELRKDEWGLDCAIAASQKGFLSPPGLSFVCLSRRASDLVRKSTSPRYYFDFRKYLESRTGPPFTPAVSLVCAVRASLSRILSIGLENLWRAGRSRVVGLKLILEAAGFEMVARNQSSVVIAFWVGDVSADILARTLIDDHGILIALGQEGLRDRVLRVSPIGKTKRDLLAFARAFEATMAKLGKPFALSDITGKLERVLEESSLWE